MSAAASALSSFASYDGLIVTGKAPKPGYLLIRDGDDCATF